MRAYCAVCGEQLRAKGIYNQTRDRISGLALYTHTGYEVQPCPTCLAEAAQDAIDGYEDSRAEAALEIQAARD